jgi:AraC family transcriptional regulator, regulatory protein of adaptative response / methylated-DNA-[protein]-cysteine methyltransferase
MTDINIDAGTDYARIAQAIAYMRQHHLNQPDLSAIATVLGLSEDYFQRLFTHWAGISPKRFLQYLTLEYAKSKIMQTQSLLDLSLDVGLSGPGRLHDLFVNIEALSPGEFKAGGAGVLIQYGVHQTPFGAALLATTPRGLCNLYFLNAEQNMNAEQLLRQSWPQADIIYNQDATQASCDFIFESVFSQSKKPLTVLVKGTNFQVQVWRALLQVPLGGMVSYQYIAQMIGHPQANRAVGTAVGQNPIAYLIPCHRVLRASGELGGYRWGLERKTAILGWEASRVNPYPPEL